MFSENLHGWQEFYTTTGRTGRAKYQLWWWWRCGQCYTDKIMIEVKFPILLWWWRCFYLILFLFLSHFCLSRQCLSQRRLEMKNGEHRLDDDGGALGPTDGWLWWWSRPSRWHRLSKKWGNMVEKNQNLAFVQLKTESIWISKYLPPICIGCILVSVCIHIRATVHHL